MYAETTVLARHSIIARTSSRTSANCLSAVERNGASIGDKHRSSGWRRLLGWGVCDSEGTEKLKLPTAQTLKGMSAPATDFRRAG